MELEFFDEEKHDYFLEDYREYSREPTEEEKDFFGPLLEDLVADISEFTGISPDFKLYFAMTDESQLVEDVPINRYVHGFSFPEWMEGVQTDFILLRAVKNRENWRDCLINMLAHEMEHQEYFSKKEKTPYSNLENIVFEGHAMNGAERVAEELEIDWTPHYRSDEEVRADKEKIMKVLDEDRTYEQDNIFQNGEKPCPEGEGYRLSYQAVRDIVERTEIELEDIPETSMERLRKEARESLENLLD